jgi:hypothetical protein
MLLAQPVSFTVTTTSTSEILRRIRIRIRIRIRVPFTAEGAEVPSDLTPLTELIRSGVLTGFSSKSGQWHRRRR